MDEDLDGKASPVQDVTLDVQSSQAINVPLMGTSPLGRGMKKKDSLSSFESPMAKSFQDRLFQRVSNQSLNNDDTDASLMRASPKTSQISLLAKVKSEPKLVVTDQRPTQKAQLTKAERRELQEQQRADKALKLGAKTVKKTTKISNSPPRADIRPPPPPKKSNPKKPHTADGKVVSLFSHLTQYDPNYSLAKDRISKGIIHPAVMSLGAQYAYNSITGGNARCVSLLIALSKVIADYTTPSGTSLQRHLTQHISKQVDFLSNTRSLAASMKTAIRFIKHEITTLDIDMSDEDAKRKLKEAIRDFGEMRIIQAGNEIVASVLNGKIKDGDVIVTFARSSLVQKVLFAAHEKGIEFSVIVVDSRPKLEGKELLNALCKQGIKCSYATTNAIHYVISQATKVIVGASSVLSNGDVMGRIGTSVVCMAAHDLKIPVLVLCEVYKFSEIVRLDSFVWNELGNPEELVDVSNRPPSHILPSVVPLPDPYLTGTRAGDLRDWRQVEDLKLLNLTYDITPAKFVTVVVCELGQIPSTLVLSVLSLINT